MTKLIAPVDPESIVIPKKPANKSASEHRKITKPIMEKKRRARINHSLEQIKSILMEQFSECAKKSNNLEKADILELTVKYLKDVTAKAQNTAMDTSSQVQLMQTGFQKCKQQVNNCLSQVDRQINQRLNQHLTKFEKRQFESNSQFDCDQVLNLSINDHILINNSFMLHTPNSACSTSSSSVFFPSSGSLSPSSDRSLSPASLDQVWRPW